MDEQKVDSIRVRVDLVGDLEKKDNLVGYKAEMFLKKLLKSNEELINKHLQDKWGLSPHVWWLAYTYVEKYKVYLKDREARQHIYDKYAEKQPIIEIISSRITDLDAKECIRLRTLFEEKEDTLQVVDEIVQHYMSELRLLIPDDTTKVKNMS